MADLRTIEIFSADCPICDDVVQRVREMACESCDVQVLDLKTRLWLSARPTSAFARCRR